MRRVVLDATEQAPFALEGSVNELLPDDATVYVDREGKTYDTERSIPLATLPEDGVVALPRTTWW
jgi:hypothetical protein